MSNLFPLPFKRTIPVNDFASSLISYINQHSTTTHPESITNDALHLHKLRNTIYGSDGVPVLLESTIQLLILYQAQLSYTLTKFPETASPSFTYYPLFSLSSSPLPPGALPSLSLPSNPPTSLPSLSYELLSTLLNLSSLYISLAHHTHSPTPQSLKTSIQYYSLALGVYHKLFSLLPKFERAGLEDSDLCRVKLESLSKVVMGLSQECGWLKAVIDRLKNGTIAKLAMQVSEYYQEALELAQRTTNPFPEEYIGYLRLKSAHFKAVSQYRRSMDDLGSNRYGDELGRLSVSQEILKTVLSSIPKPQKGSLLSELMKDSRNLLKTIEENLIRANKDNDLIYLSHPTPPSALPPIVPFSLVKPSLQLSVQNPLKWILEEGQESSRIVFGGMERREVGAVLEIWEDRKKSWMEEEVKGWCKRREVEERKLLKDLNLPSSLDQLQQTSSLSSQSTITRPQSLPQSLSDQSQEIQRLGGTSKLQLLFKDVSKTCSINSKLLSEANEHLQSERITEEFYSTTHSPTHWTRPSSTTISQPLSDRISHLNSLLQSAQSSDLVIRQKYAQVSKRLQLLESPQEELRKVLPRMEEEVRERVAEPPSLELKRVERKLRGLLEDLKGLGLDRGESLRRVEGVEKQWDIRKEVARRSDEIALMELEDEGERDQVEGLEQFEEVLGRGLEGLKEGSGWELERRELETRGEEILNGIRSANTTFTSLLIEQQPSTASQTPSSAVPSARTDFLSSMSEAHSKYLEMLGNLEEGLKFYSDLSRLATELRESCKNFAYSRNLEAQELDKRLTTPPTPTVPEPQSESEPGPSPQEEEDSPLIEQEDPISAAFSQPLNVPTTTPRRSNRRTPTTTTTDSPLTRQTRKLPTKSSSTTPRKPKKEEEEEKQQVQQQQGGWDPSMGIRFG
ncbi:hypothetical protein JCM5353_008683 [Sporobolomyces roseus]